MTFEYATPRPSLCDKCKNAHILYTGDVGIGRQIYRQRYCSTRGSAAETKTEHGVVFDGISIGGFLECPMFEDDGNSEPEELPRT